MKQNSRQEWLESCQANNVLCSCQWHSDTRTSPLIIYPLTDLQEGPHLFGDAGAFERLVQGGAWRWTEQRFIPEGAQCGHLLGHQP